MRTLISAVLILLLAAVLTRATLDCVEHHGPGALPHEELTP